MYSATPFDLAGLVEVSDSAGTAIGNISEGDNFDFETSLPSIETSNTLAEYQNDSDILSGRDAVQDQYDAGELIDEDSSSIRHELVVVDSAVDDHETLLNNLGLTEQDLIDFEILFIDSNSDGVHQITSALGKDTTYDAIHILSHATNGNVQLGNTTLGAHNLHEYSDSFVSWKTSLSAESDVLLYGCDLAGSVEGQSLIDSLALLCDCDVAASDDVTGHEDLGGDWNLEYSIGSIETEIAISSNSQSAWHSSLASIVVTTTADENNGATGGVSLREAIITANGNAEDDIITLGAGTYLMSISGGDDFAAVGDYDITSNITIIGDGMDTTIIDADSLDRLFDVRSGTLTLNDLQLTGGNTPNISGGGIVVRSGATAILNSVDIYDNDVQWSVGGGISNEGTLYLTDSLIRGSNANNTGGGLHNTGNATLNEVSIIGNTSQHGAGIEQTAGTLDITNATFNGNSADFDGAGIRMSGGTATVNYSTFADNDASAGGEGGAIRYEAGSITISNSIFADNLSQFGGADIEGAVTSDGNNIVEDYANFTPIGSDITGAFDLDPVSVDASSGQYVYALTSGNAAIDAGGGSPPTTDIRGIARDGNPDIGSFEFTSGNSAPTDLLIDWNDPDIDPRTAEVTLNTSSSGNQSEPQVDELTNGNKIVVWHADNVDGSGSAVMSRLVDNAGNPLAAEFQINATTAGNQDSPDVTALIGGGFVVTWESAGQDGSGEGVYARIYNNAGIAVTGEILVSTTISGDQDQPSIAGLADGGFVIVMTSQNVDAAGKAIIGQRFDAAGSMVGIEFQINTTEISDQLNPSVAENPNGGFVVAWESDEQDGDGVGIYARAYDASGAATTGEIQVNTTTTNSQLRPAVVVRDDGSFAVSFLDQSSGNDAVVMRVFDSSGTPLTAEIQVESDARVVDDMSIAVLPDQSFIVAWSSEGYHGSGGYGSFAYSAHVTSDGSTVNGHTRLSEGTTRFWGSYDPALSANSDGTLLVVYTAAGPEYENSDIVARKIALAGVEEDASNGTVVATASTVDPDSGDSFTYTLTDTAGGRFAIDSVTGIITIADSSQIDFETAVSHDIIIRTTDGGGETYDETLTIHVEDMNESPVLSLPPGQIAPVVFSAANGNAITFSDVDSDHFRIDLSVDDGTLTLGSTDNISFYDGDGTNDTSMTFGGLLADITAALDGLTFAAGVSSPATITVTIIDDGTNPGGSTLSDTGTILVSSTANSSPILSDLDDNPTFIEDGTAVVLDVDVTVVDTELDALNSGNGDYDGASLILVRDGGANSNDVFGFSDGNGITLSGNSLVKNSQVVATFDQSSTPGQLVLTFTNANGETPTSADVNNVLQQITYSNSSDTPASTVQINWNFSDGNTGAQGLGGAFNDTGSTTVNITAVNDVPQFGADAGFLTTDINGDDSASDIILQSDGKFILVGDSNGSGNQDLTLTRYNSNGTLDVSFGSNGVVTSTVTASNDGLTSVTLQSDGKILVAGGTDNGPNYDAILARYNTDGSLDTTFGGTGVVVTDAGGYDWLYDVKVQSDGKIVTGGFSFVSDYDFLAIRYNSDGSLDTTFDSDGVVSLYTGAYYDLIESIEIQSDGKVILGGYTYNSDYDVTLVRLNSDGSLDTSFDTDGILINSLAAGLDFVYDVELQTDGKIVVAGGATEGANIDVLLARFNTDGSIDTSFSGDGYTTVDFGLGDDEGVDLTILADGSFVIASTVSNGSNNDFGIVKFASDGSLDTSFSSDGMQTTSIGSGDDTVYGIAVQSDGKILVAGETDNGSDSDFAVVRYLADGTLDAVFGQTDGLDGTPNFVEGGLAVLLDADVNVLDTELDSLNSGNGNYAGSSLTIVRNGGADSEDMLSFVDGNGITLSGSNLIKNGQIIATFDTSSTAGELVITFTDSNGEIPTTADVDNVFRQINYSNTSDSPPVSAQLDWTFNDGDSVAPLTAVGSTTISFDAVNDTPVVGAPASALNASEGISLDLHGTGFNVSDADLSSGGAIATLSVGEGILTIVAGDSGITIDSGNGTAIVTLSGTMAQINSLLTGSGTGSIAYLNSNDLPSTSTTLTVLVNDQGNAGADPGLTADGSSEEGSNSQTINITNVNDAPVQSAIEGSPLAYTENDGPVQITNSITIADSDDTNIESATVQITSNYLNGEDLLAFVNTANITGSWNSTNGTLTLVGNDTLANYETALQSVFYSNTSDNPSSLTRTIGFIVNDGEADSNALTRDITVGPVNDAPFNAGGLPTDIAVTEGISSNVDLSAIDLSDIDHNGGILSATLSTSTGGNLSASSTSGVTVSGSNTNTLSLTGTLADLNSYFNNSSSISYLHSVVSTSGNDADTLQVVVSDNGNTGSGGGGSITLGTANVDIGGVNNAPVNTLPGTQTVAEETPASITGISIADTDAGAGYLATRLQVNNGILNVSLSGLATISAGSNGSGDLTILGTVADINASLASLTYTGNTDVVGVAADSLTVTTNDQGNTGAGGALSDIDSLQINITNVNDVPVANADSYSVVTTETLVVSAPGVLSNDTDIDSPSLSAVLITAPADGVLTLNADGSFTYVPEHNFSGTVTFDYAASDGSLSSAPATVTIEVLEASGAPYTPPEFGEGDESQEGEDADQGEEGSGEEIDEVISPPTSDDGNTIGVLIPPVNLSPVDDSTSGWDRYGHDLDVKPIERSEFEKTGHELLFEKNWFGNNQVVTTTVNRHLPVHQAANISLEAAVSSDIELIEYWLNTAEVEQAHEIDATYLVGAASNLLVGLSTGYLAWSVGGTYLIAAMAGSMPAWSRFDPIYVLDNPTISRSVAKEEQSLADLASGNNEGGGV